MKVGRLFCVRDAVSTAFCQHCCRGAAEPVGYEEGGGYQVPGSAVTHIGWVIGLFCAPFYIYENGGSATSLQMAGQLSVGGCEFIKSRDPQLKASLCRALKKDTPE